MFAYVCRVLVGRSPAYRLILLAVLTVSSFSPALFAQASYAGVSGNASTPDVSLSAWPTQPVPGAVASPNFSVPDGMIAFGDSITRCLTLTDASTCYVNRLARYFGLTSVQDLGISGSLACAVARRQVFPLDSPSLGTTQPLRTLMVGTNDVNYKNFRIYQSQFDQCDQSILAWLATPLESKVLGSSTVSGAMGSCAVDTTFAAAHGILCNAPGSSVSFSLTTTGKPIYLWFRSIDGDTGTYTYQIDNSPAVTLTTAMAKPIRVQNTVSDSVVFRRIPASAGKHTIRFVQSTAGTMAVVAVGTPSDAPAANRPYLVVADVPRQLDGLHQSEVAEYGAEIRANIQLLKSDGLNLIYVPVSQYLTATTEAGDMHDTAHPNSLGHGELFSAFLTQVEQLAPPSFGPQSPLTLTAAVVPATGNPEPTGQMKFYVDTAAVGSALLSAGHATLTTRFPLPVGLHQLSAVYGGDGDTTAVHSPTIETTITGQATSTRLTVSAPVLPFGAPVKLAARVTSGSQRVTRGNVAFLCGDVALGTSAIGSDGLARWTSTTLPIGKDLLRATFLAHDEMGSSTSAPASIVIAPLKASTTLLASPSSATQGTSVTLLAHVTSDGLPVNSGNRTISSLTGSIGMAPLRNSGTATLITSALAARNYHLIATFFGAGYLRKEPFLQCAAIDYPCL